MSSIYKCLVQPSNVKLRFNGLLLLLLNVTFIVNTSFMYVFSTTDSIGRYFYIALCVLYGFTLLVSLYLFLPSLHTPSTAHPHSQVSSVLIVLKAMLNTTSDLG